MRSVTFHDIACVCEWLINTGKDRNVSVAKRLCNLYFDALGEGESIKSASLRAFVDYLASCQDQDVPHITLRDGIIQANWAPQSGVRGFGFTHVFNEGQYEKMD